MRLKDFKSVPSAITSARIVIAPALWITGLLHLKTYFGLLLLAAGITDIVDGFLARMLKQHSKTGARLDTIADILAGSSLILIFALIPDFARDNWMMIAALIFLLAGTFIAGSIKERQIIHHHLYSQKVSEFLSYLFVIHAVLFEPSIALFYLAAAAIILSRIELNYLVFVKKDNDPEKKSIFA